MSMNIENLLRRSRTPERDQQLYDAGVSLFQKLGSTDDPAAVLRLMARVFREVADGGDLRAMIDYGRCLWNGWGVPQDQDAAMDLYQKAADLGSDYGAYVFAQNLYWTFEVYDQAFVYAEKALVGGDPDGDVSYLLGLMAYNGRGCPVDHAESLRFYQDAALKDHANANFELAVFAIQGIAQPKNFALGVDYMMNSARLGNQRACGNIAGMYVTGEIPGAGVDYVKGVEWYRKAAELGHARAYAILGIMCINGQGMQFDPLQVTRYFDAAEDLGFDVSELLQATKTQWPQSA